MDLSPDLSFHTLLTNVTNVKDTGTGTASYYYYCNEAASLVPHHINGLHTLQCVPYHSPYPA